MAHKHAARLRETSTTIGTGDYTTSGVAVPGGFATIASKLTTNGDTGWFCVVMLNQFEIVRLQRVTATQYARSQVFDGSSGTSAVNWGAGTKDIFSVTPPQGMASREYLSSNITIFVRSDATGDTGRTGLVDSTASAFLTWQAAYNYVLATYNFNGFTVTIKAGGTGVRTFAPASGTPIIQITQPWHGPGALVFEGDTAVKDNVRLNATNADCISTGGVFHGPITFKGFRFNTTTAGSGLDLRGAGRIHLANTNYFVACVNSFLNINNDNVYVSVDSGAILEFEADTAQPILVDSGYLGSAGTITVTGGRTFDQLIQVNFRGFAWIGNVTGTWTGKDYLVNDGATLRSSIAESSWGGSLAGSLSGGGIFIDGFNGVGNLGMGRIFFPVAQQASSDPNCFDDYEEGTFTPVLGFGGTGGATYSTQIGRYQKKGNRVNIEISIVITNNGGGAGNAAITGLPFTPANTNSWALSFSGDNVTVNGHWQPLIQASDATIYLQYIDGTGAATNATDTQITNTASIIITGWYETVN